jgi:peptidoglycan/xylan/chitin deacetylase (PgdA/CDA1 family)
MFWHHTPVLIQKSLWPFVWRMDTDEKVIYLTFDDGPIPTLTEQVLDILAQFEARATFFCVGENVKRNPSIFEQLQKQGHSVGNHTYSHLNGWKTPTQTYLDNWQKCQDVLPRTRLFRPPYGKMTPSQVYHLRTKTDIILWDVLTGDFSPTISQQQCLAKTSKYTQNGSIVVFHDNVKAERNLLYTLPALLRQKQQEGFRFEALPM